MTWIGFRPTGTDIEYSLCITMSSCRGLAHLSTTTHVLLSLLHSPLALPIRHMHDKAYKQLSKHCGDNYYHMKGMYNHRAFAEMLANLKADFTSRVLAVETGVQKLKHDKTLNVVFLCKAGRHRAPACARFAQVIFASLGFAST